MATPPTLSANLGLAAGAGASRASASISWSTGDIVVVAQVDEGNGNESFSSAPTATGLTFSNNPINHAANSNCALAIWWATAGSSGSSTITGHSSSTGSVWNMWVWVWHNTGGVGNVSSQFTATKTVSLTPAGGVDSGIIWVVGDWSAGSSPAATPTSPNETTRQAVKDGSIYSYVTADITDQTSSSGVLYGISGGSASGPFSIGVLEIKGTPSAATNQLMLTGCGL